MADSRIDVNCLRSSLLDTAKGVHHAFCTRQGGVSEGLHYSLNCGFGTTDDPINVEHNRALALAQLPLLRAELITCNQAHSSNVVFVVDPWDKDEAPIADGMVTNRPNLALGILSADCAPVLLADPSSGIIGAVHAGWRGALAGVIERTIELMAKHGAKVSKIITAIGPCIGLQSYEVDAEFKGLFVKNDSKNEIYFYNGKLEGKYLFDLSSYVKYRLNRVGIEYVSNLKYDTCADIDKFFSYRRSVLTGENDCGRGISLIALTH